MLVSGNLVLGALVLGGAVEAALLLAVAVPVVLAVLRRPQRGMLLLLTLVPFNGLLEIVPHPGWASAWKEALVVAVLGATFLAPASTRAPAGRRLPSWFPAVAALLAVSVGSAATTGGAAAAYGLKISFFYLLIAWAVWRCPPDPAERDRMVTILFATAVICAVYGLAQQNLGADQLNGMGYEYNTTIRFAGGLLRSFSSFVQPFGFGFYVMAVMLVGLAVVLADPKRLRSRLFLLCMPVMFAGMLTSVVRGAWLGFAAGIVYLGFRRHRGLLLVVPLAMVAVLLLPSNTTSEAAFSPQSTQERATGWGERTQELLSRPFGAGMGSTGAAAEKAQNLGGVLDADYYAPDNQFFLVLYELGVLGLWCLLLLFGWVLVSLRRAERGLAGVDGALAAGVSAMVVAAAVASLTASYLQIFPMDVLWWVLITVVATTASPSGSTPAPAASAALVNA